MGFVSALAPNLLDSIAVICKEYGVAELSLFGSAARDDFDPKFSDYDFLVEYKSTADVSLLPRIPSSSRGYSVTGTG